MSDSFEFTLHSPLTQEDWNKITDAEYENTMSVTFQTPQGRQVRYIRCDVLDKISDEIEARLCDVVSDYTDGFRTAIQGDLAILDKYKTESEE